MADFIRFQLKFDVIEDLPGRVDTILHALAGNAELPEDFNLPKSDFFEGEDWKEFANKGLSDGSPSIVDFCFDGRTLIAHGIDMADNRKLPGFLTWVFPYMEDKGRECLGSFKVDDWPFPSLVVRSEKGVSVLDMDKVLLSDHPVLVIPGEMKIIPFPNPEQITGDMAQKLFKLIGMLGNTSDDDESCDGCGDCKDQTEEELKN